MLPSLTVPGQLHQLTEVSHFTREQCSWLKEPVDDGRGQPFKLQA